MQGLVRQAEIVDVDSSDSDEEGMGDSHTKAEGEEGGHHHGGGSPGSARGQLQGCVLYTHGVRSCHFTLVLQARSTLHQSVKSHERTFTLICVCWMPSRSPH